MESLRQLGDAVSAQFRGLHGQHPGQWPLVPRLACALAAMLVVMVLGWLLYWDGQLEQLDAGQKAELQLREIWRAKLQQSINLDALRKQKDKVGEYVLTLEKQLPSKAEMDALLSDINQAGLGRGLQFELFKPGQVIVKDYYAELPIDIKISGSYHDIGSFNSDIANLPRIVTLNNMSLVAGKEGNLTLDAVAKTFRYLDAEEINLQRKAAAAKKAEAAGAKK